jgi:hypothetical protein
MDCSFAYKKTIHYIYVSVYQAQGALSCSAQGRNPGPA